MATADALPTFEATLVVTGDDEQDDRGRPVARYISREFNAATIVRAEVLARQWAERDGGCDFVEIAEAITSEDDARMAQAAAERAWLLGECYEACGREAVHLDERAGELSVPYCDECLPRAVPHV